MRLTPPPRALLASCLVLAFAGAAAGVSAGSTSGGSVATSLKLAAGPPNLVVTGSASNTAPSVGDNVTFYLTVTDKNVAPAQSLYVNISLPAGLQYVSSTADRGSACTAITAASLKCFLDWLSSDAPAGHLQVVTKVIADGAQTMTATATSQQGVSSTADATLALILNDGTTSTASSTSGVPVGLNGNAKTTTKKTVDKKAPSSRAVASNGKRGATVKLLFHIYDEGGVAKALATIERNGKMFATASTGFGPVAFGTTYYLGWHVPALAPKGTYKFCVVAFDRAGNHSRSSCAPLALK